MVAQKYQDVLIVLAFLVALVLFLEAHRRLERARVARHPSAMQGSCVRVFRPPFDWSMHEEYS